MGVLQISIQSANSEYPYDARYLPTLTLTELKAKLELVVGVLSQNMRLKLHDEHGKFLSELTASDKTLEELGVVDKYVIHVEDVSGNALNLNTPLDPSARFVMDSAKYDSREDSVRKWMKDLGVDKTEIRIPDFAQVGNRCVVELPGQQQRSGTIAFTGKTHFKAGNWVGVVYDQPVGKNDGSVDGQRYFLCEPKHGGFVSPKCVYPEATEDGDAAPPNTEIEEI